MTSSRMRPDSHTQTCIPAAMTMAIAMTHNSKVVNRGYLIIFNMCLHMPHDRNFSPVGVSAAAGAPSHESAAKTLGDAGRHRYRRVRIPLSIDVRTTIGCNSLEGTSLAGAS